MKALILAAGLGTRLRPLTNTIPKPLLPIAGKPLLQYHLDQLTKHGVNDVLINTHYLPEKISTYIDEYGSMHDEMNIVTSFEETLLGSAGSLKMNQDFFSTEEDFFIVYGENLTDIDYTTLMDYHKSKGGLVTIAGYREEHPEQKGVIEYASDARITRFVEKPGPGETTSSIANAGIYVINKKIFAYLSKLNTPVLDFGYDLFPYLLEKDEDLYMYTMTEIVLDIGTHENYHKASTLLKSTTLR